MNRNVKHFFSSRRAAIYLALGPLWFCTACAGQDIPWPTDDWTISTPAAQQLDSEVFSQLDSEIQAGKYGLVDRMVVVRHGMLVVNKRYANNYQEISRGRQSPLGCGFESCPDSAAASDPYNYLHPGTHPYYQGREVHSLQSVTKSVAATLVGIALTRGEIDNVQVPLLSFFSNYTIPEGNKALQRATLEDLLTMRSGIEWHEMDRPLDETNTTIQLERSQDWIQFTLDQPLDAEPGQKWVYNSGGSHLMSGVIKAATGSFIDSYAELHLFGPLGIKDYHWKKSPRGYPDTEGGLYLEAEQLAKIGYLYLMDGSWQGRKILDPQFVASAIAKQVSNVNPRGWGYGYQWWRLDRDGKEVWAGLGFGEQYLFVIPEYQLIGVINSWNLFGPPQQSIMRDFLDGLLESVHE